MKTIMCVNLKKFPSQDLIMEIMQISFFHEFVFFAHGYHVSKTRMMHV
jgi:hypothetical protein